MTEDACATKVGKVPLTRNGTRQVRMVLISKIEKGLDAESIEASLFAKQSSLSCRYR